MHALIRWKQDSTDNPYNIMTVNLRDSKNKSCRDRDFSRLAILRDVETETLRDQEILRMSRLRLSKSFQDQDFIKSLLITALAHIILVSSLQRIKLRGVQEIHQIL